MKKLLFFTAVVIFAVLGFLFFQKITKPEIKTVKVEKKKLVKAVYASGNVKPVNQIDIKSEVSGYVRNFKLEEGDKINKNQIVAQIENRTINDLLSETEKQIKRVKEKLQKDSEFRKQFENQIEIEKANLKLLEGNYKRRKTLFEKKQVSKEEIQTLKNQIEITKNKIRLLKNQYEDKIKDLENQLQILKDKRKQILDEKEKYSIKSPISGTVLKTYVSEGDYVNSITSNNTILTVGDLSKMETILEVDEEYIPLIKPEMKVVISIDAFPDKVFEGKIVKITGKSDPKTRTVEVKADVKYPVKIPSGITVESNIIVKEKETTAVPISALIENRYVKVFKEDGKIEKRKIKTGIKANGFVEVLKGLEEGEKVVVQ
jgi:HlyD family secretion protein